MGGLVISLISLTTLLPHFLYQTKGHFLSVEDLEEFYDLEEKLVKTFTTYIEEQKEFLEVVKQRHEEQKRWQPVVNNTDEYLGNPLNVHAMLKRLVSDWPITLALLGGSLADELEDEEEDMMTLPSVEEYHGAVHSLTRIQQVYNYSTEEIISGSAFPNTDNTSLLTGEDCLALGKDFYDHRHYQKAISWLQIALAQAKNKDKGVKVVATTTGSEQTKVSPSVETIYEYLALATCFVGNDKQSKKYFKKLYSEYPDFRPTPELIKDHLLYMNDTCRKLINNDILKPVDHELTSEWQEDAKLSEDYNKLCQAETLSNVSRGLNCMLIDWKEPYWRLQPLKTELLHLNPRVYMTYNLISPVEGQFLMEKMMNEEIKNVNGFVYEFWQPLPQNSTVSESIVRRTSKITAALVPNTREQTKLASFPPGAEYTVRTVLPMQKQNPRKERLGSTVYFLQEPKKGGLVVFPRLGLSVAPVSGAALTMFGLNKEEKVDEKAAYGVCPILQGQATTLTLWFKRDH